MNPCCGMSLRKGTKVIAIVNLVFSLIFFVFGVVAIAKAVESKRNYDNAKALGENVEQYKAAAAGAPGLIVYIVFTVGCVVSLFFPVVLLDGADKRNFKKCTWWFVFNAFSVVITIINLFLGFSDDPVYVITGRGGGIFLHFYFLWVVWAFMSQIKQETQPIPKPFT